MSRAVLKNPFVIEWKQSTNEKSSSVFESLKEILGPLRKKSKRKSLPNNTKNLLENSSPIEENETKNETDKTSESIKTKHFKQYFVIGTAQNLRELEKKTLSCSIFDRSLLKPAPIAFQIGTLCVNSGAFCACMDDLSANLGSFLGMPCSVMALGIRKSAVGNLEIEKLLETIKNCLNQVVMKSSSVDEENPSKKFRYIPPTVVFPEIKKVLDKKRKNDAKNKKKNKKLKSV